MDDSLLFSVCVLWFYLLWFKGPKQCIHWNLVTASSQDRVTGAKYPYILNLLENQSIVSCEVLSIVQKAAQKFDPSKKANCSAVPGQHLEALFGS